MLTIVIILDLLGFAQFSYNLRVNVDQLAPLGSSPPCQVTEIRFIPSWTPTTCGSSLPVTLGKENVNHHLGKSRGQNWKCRISLPSVFHGLIRDSRRDGGCCAPVSLEKNEITWRVPGSVSATPTDQSLFIKFYVLYMLLSASALIMVAQWTVYHLSNNVIYWHLRHLNFRSR